MNNRDLDYPWNLEFLSMKKLSLLKKLKKTNNNHSLKIIGGYTSNNVCDWLKIFSSKNGITIDLVSSDWGKGYVCALNYISTKKFHDVIIVINSFVDLISKNEFEILKKDVNDILKIYRIFINFIIKNKINCTLTLFDYPTFLEDSDLSFKNKCLIDDLNKKLIKLTDHIPFVSIVNPISFFSYAGINNNFDFRNWSLYGNLYDLDQSIFIAHQLSIPIRSYFGIAKKILILDLDNTIWGGVIGDSKIQDIKVSPDDPEGRLFINFQYFIKSLKSKGILLALCSKNNESIVAEAFNELDMPLKFDDFIIKKINWKNKHENIIDICKELNLSLDSVVFCDDNPSEREEVKSFLPEVSCPNIGNDPSKYTSIIDINQYFKNYIPITNEDKNRNKSYKILKQHLIDKKKFKNQQDFINSLNLNISIEILNTKNINRVHQLLNKTNQFNLTTKRVSINFLETNMIDKWHLVIRVKDKFVDHGIVSFVYGTNNKNQIIIDNWVLSCRVFNKNIEGSILQFLITKAFKFKVNEVHTLLKETSKNLNLKNTLEDIGFIVSKFKSKNLFLTFNTQNYKINKDLININDNR